MVTTSGYGTWESPVTSAMSTVAGVGLTDLIADGDKVYWNELRYSDGGRGVICSADVSGKIEEWTPHGFDARTTVHEYGGGSFFVHDGTVYFCNYADQALYRQHSIHSTPEPVVDVERNFKYADGRFCAPKSRIYCVREDFEILRDGAAEHQNTIVSIDPETKEQRPVVLGADFYICPRTSVDGKHLVWVQWVHPNMPWDSTEIWRAELSEDGDSVIHESLKKVVGGKDAKGMDLSVIMPYWTAQNEILYIGDQTNWWNLYHVTSGGKHVNLHPVKAEIGGPQWTMSRTQYVQNPNGNTNIVTVFKGQLGLLDSKSKKYTKISTGFCSHSNLGWAYKGLVYCFAYSETKFEQVIRIDLDQLKRKSSGCCGAHLAGTVDTLRVTRDAPVGKEYISLPKKISWKTNNKETSHGWFYRPCNKDYCGPKGELPPVLVRAHEGPTNAFPLVLDLELQYFTSRGFAALLVDYRGSTGYGKKYRHRLRNSWGVLDIQDCCSGTDYVIRKKWADPNRTCIDGKSAGGYTTLACLTFTDTFKVGASHYGVSDLLALMKTTHKFESRYLDTLLAPLGKGGEEIAKARSPIYHLDKLHLPMGLFQGDEDKIVPPSQARSMFNAVDAKKIPALLVMFPGEQHYFRKAESLKKALDGEFYFFSKVLNFWAADQGLAEIPIVNLGGSFHRHSLWDVDKRASIFSSLIRKSKT